METDPGSNKEARREEVIMLLVNIHGALYQAAKHAEENLSRDQESVLQTIRTECDDALSYALELAGIKREKFRSRMSDISFNVTPSYAEEAPSFEEVIEKLLPK